MGLVIVIGLIYIGGPIGIGLIVIGAICAYFKKNRTATALIIIGIVLCATAVVFENQLSQVNFGL